MSHVGVSAHARDRRSGASRADSVSRGLFCLTEIVRQERITLSFGERQFSTNLPIMESEACAAIDGKSKSRCVSKTNIS